MRICLAVQHRNEKVVSCFRHIPMESVSEFSDELREVFNKVVGAAIPGALNSNINEQSSRNASTERLIFIDAPGGTGKIFVTSAIQRFLKSKEKNIVIITSFAVAANPLDDGHIFHSALQLRIQADQESTYNVSTDRPLLDTLRKVYFLVWDEIVRIHRNSMEAFGRTLRDVTRSTLPTMFCKVVPVCYDTQIGHAGSPDSLCTKCRTDI